MPKSVHCFLKKNGSCVRKMQVHKAPQSWSSLLLMWFCEIVPYSAFLPCQDITCLTEGGKWLWKIICNAIWCYILIITLLPPQYIPNLKLPPLLHLLLNRLGKESAKTAASRVCEGKRLARKLSGPWGLVDTLGSLTGARLEKRDLIKSKAINCRQWHFFQQTNFQK